MSATVIPFPGTKQKPFSKKEKSKSTSSKKEEAELQINLDMMRNTHIQETLQTLSPVIFERLMAMGFDFTDFQSDSEIKHGSFFVEALHSLLCKYYNVYHPFQSVAENIFEKLGENDLTVTDELHLKFIDTAKPQSNT